MIFGLGTDIAKTSRFEKWVQNPEMIRRFFNKNEITSFTSVSAACCHYAARFAAKEAFSKALGTGLCAFNLSDVYIKNNSDGKPFIFVEDTAANALKKICGKCKIHVSLSHEKEYAVACVIIEIPDDSGEKWFPE